MAHPVEPSFGRHGEYSTGRSAVEAFRQGSFTTPISMYHGNGQQQEPLNFWQKVTMRADSVRDAMGDRCCRCLHHMPSLVLIIGILLIIGLAIAAVPVAFVLVSNAGQSAEQKGGDEIAPGGTNYHPIRHGSDSLWPGYNEDADVEDRHDLVRVISASALFPRNVSLCHGFGFACTSTPSMVISTAQRCDGRADCADGSDEVECLECHTPYQCNMTATSGGRSHWQICLRAEQVCDGIANCPDRSDETEFCRKSSESCPAGSRRCSGSPLCLKESSFCDGEPECRGDDDEKQCKECKKGAKMCAPLGRCMPRSQLCDGVVHCPDGSDEMDCDCKSCSGSDRALCTNGRCLERGKVCDGTIDCEGGLDEASCPGTCRAAPSTAASTLSSLKTVQCADGRHYPETEACSGLRRVCARSCPKCDSKLTFTCPDGVCIRKMLVCDGRPDCAGGEDEKDCPTACPSTAHKCGKKCVPAEAKCDGVQDCEDGSDESRCKECPSTTLRCSIDNRCFPANARCDGVSDCTDGSDEAECSCEECTGAHSDTYACEASSHCFKRHAVCNPYSLCPNATHADKLFCAARSLIHKNNLF